MLHAKLVREGFAVNVKVVERLYREERLWLRRTKRKKIPREGREGSWCPIAADQRRAGQWPQVPHRQSQGRLHPRVPGDRGGFLVTRRARRGNAGTGRP